MNSKEHSMRLKLLAAALMIPAVAVLLSPGYGQQPYRSGMQKKGKGGGKMDPAAFFERIAKGRGYFLVSEAPYLGPSLGEFARSKGITDDKIYLETYMGWSEEFRSKGGMYAKGTMPGGGGPPGTGAATPALDVNQRAELDFKLKD